GIVAIRSEDFLRVWHDVGTSNAPLNRYGIAVGPPAPTTVQTEAFAPPAPEDADVGMGGQRGATVDRRLEAAISHGSAILTAITRAAIARLLDRGAQHHAAAFSLFSPEELNALTDALAATLATSDQLARALIRDYQARVEANHSDLRQESLLSSDE